MLEQRRRRWDNIRPILVQSYISSSPQYFILLDCSVKILQVKAIEFSQKRPIHICCFSKRHEIITDRGAVSPTDSAKSLTDWLRLDHVLIVKTNLGFKSFGEIGGRCE